GSPLKVLTVRPEDEYQRVRDSDREQCFFIEARLGVYKEIVEIQPVDQRLKAVVQHADVIAFAQNPCNLAGFQAGWNKEDLAVSTTKDMAHVVGTFFDVAAAPEIVVQSASKLGFIHPKEDM